MKKRRTAPRSKLVFQLALMVIFALWMGLTRLFPPPQSVQGANENAAQPGPERLSVKVIRVIDGDTIEIETGERVRLIGVDSPESRKNTKAFRDSKRTGQDVESIVRMGKQSKQVLSKLVDQRNVRLEFDVGRKDKYGRLLAYVYCAENELNKDLWAHFYQLSGPYEIFVNATLVKLGYASPMTVSPNVKYAALFHDLDREAREHKRGLWRLSEVALSGVK